MRRTQKLLRLALAAAAARASAPRPARALAGHDHDHPVCDEEYRNTVCPVACDADTLRDKCCIHEGEVATLLTVAMEAQSRAIAPRIERFEECTGGHVELVPLGASRQHEGAAADPEAPGVRERRRGLPRDAHAPHAHRIRRQGVVGPVGLGGRHAGRRGGAADSGEQGERVAGLVE